MRAALALLGQADVGPRGRRIAVLGDMLELGPHGAELHRELAEPVVDARRRSRLLLRSADARAVGGSSLRPPGRLCRDLGGAGTAGACRHPAGRCRHGQRLARLPDGPIVKALESRYRRAAALAAVRSKADRMLYWLSAFSDTIGPLNVLPLHHVPHRRRDDHRADLRVPVRPVDHRPPAAAGRARASRSAATARSRISSPRRARPPWAG